MNVKDLGTVTAYGAAIEGGYVGTYEEFCRMWTNASYLGQAKSTPENRNNQFRGKCLGSHMTEAQHIEVINGTFNDIYLGDYWEKDGIKFRIWHFDYFGNSRGGTNHAHHIIIFPDCNILKPDGKTTHYMNDTNTTQGGYKATKLRKTYLPQCLEVFKKVFSNYIMEHKELLTNAVSEGQATGWEWVLTKIEIPNEHMMYGSKVTGKGERNAGGNHNQLALARICEKLVSGGPYQEICYWLRDVADSGQFAFVDDGGFAGWYSASDAWFGVRPYIAVA